MVSSPSGALAPALPLPADRRGLEGRVPLPPVVLVDWVALTFAADIRLSFFAAGSVVFAAGVTEELACDAAAAESVLSPAGVAPVFSTSSAAGFAAVALGVLVIAADVFAADVFTAGVFCCPALGVFAREAFADLVAVLGVLAAAFLGVLVAGLGVFATAAAAAAALGVSAAGARVFAAAGVSGSVSVGFGVFAAEFLGTCVRAAGLGVFAADVRGVLVAAAGRFAAEALGVLAADFGAFAEHLEADTGNLRVVLAAGAALPIASAAVGRGLAVFFRMRPIAPLGWATSCVIFSVALLPSLAFTG